MNIKNRFKRGWNAFLGRDPTETSLSIPMLADRPHINRLHFFNERSITASIYNRIAIDCSQIDIYHTRVDNGNNFLSIINDSLNDRLTLYANKDQTSEFFFRSLVMSLLDEGCVAVVPIDTTDDPNKTESFEINSMRVGRIINWYPDHIKTEVYNDRTGKKQEIIVPKKSTAIIENPFYSVMNEKNSMMYRLKRLLNQIDQINTQNASTKLDLLIQVPYQLKTKSKEDYVNRRRKEIESELEESKYGIGYLDSTEKVIQLNRSIENNLWDQAKDLISQIYSQLSITESILDGTADETTMINYYNQTINPILGAIVQEFKVKFLSKTAITQGQSIQYFRDAFKLARLIDLSEISDKFTRNAILSTNEIRSKIGFTPSDDPKANELSNKNIADVNQLSHNEQGEEFI